MARQEGLFKFSGKLGKVVGVKTKRGYYVRTLPDVSPERRANDPVYEPCRKSAGKFGENSTFGTYIRHCLSDYLELMADRSLNNRLISRITDARKWCMKDNPDGSLDIRKVAPALRRFSLRDKLSLNDLDAITFSCLKGEDENVFVLQIPKMRRSRSIWRGVNVEIVRWHIALIPLPRTADQPIAHVNEFLATDWMPIDKMDPIQIPIERPQDAQGPTPLLLALGFEPAQGTPEQSYPLRTLSVMEILEII